MGSFGQINVGAFKYVLDGFGQIGAPKQVLDSFGQMRVPKYRFWAVWGNKVTRLVFGQDGLNQSKTMV